MNLGVNAGAQRVRAHAVLDLVEDAWRADRAGPRQAAGLLGGHRLDRIADVLVGLVDDLGDAPVEVIDLLVGRGVAAPDLVGGLSGHLGAALLNLGAQDLELGLNDRAQFAPLGLRHGGHRASPLLSARISAVWRTR